MNFFKALLPLLLLLSQSSFSANWLSLQGLEPISNNSKPRFWGFIQPQFQKDFSSPNVKKQFIPPKLIGPNLTSQSAFNIFRARLGARGRLKPSTNNVNYFILAEFGNNSITVSNNAFAKMTDASLTFGHIKIAKVRIGLFKTPISEEVFQGITNFSFINFTDGANALLIERLPEKNYSTSSYQGPQSLPAQNSFNTYTQPTAAARDVGIQIFNTFKVNNYELSYAVMYGNGNGLNLSDNDQNKDLYLYFSTEKVISGQGPKRQGYKFYIWNQSGKRSFDGNNDQISESYERIRRGLGLDLHKSGFHLSAEFIDATGMLFLGPNKSNYAFVPAGAALPDHQANGLKKKADAWHIELGSMIGKTKFQVLGRYGVLNNLKNSIYQQKFTTLTLGSQYHFSKTLRLTVNYDIRDYKAINLNKNHAVNTNLDGVGNRLNLQLTAIF